MMKKMQNILYATHPNFPNEPEKRKSGNYIRYCVTKALSNY